MRRVSLAEAYRAMRLLADTASGKLTGRRLRADDRHRYHLDPLDPAAAELVQRAVYRRRDEPVMGDMPLYVVASDDVPVAWLSHHGHVVTPVASLTVAQQRHRSAVVYVLGTVRPWAFAELADARDRRENRTDGALPDDATGPWVRVAAASEPTHAWWTQPGQDYAAARGAVTDLVGADDFRVIDSRGYGEYARQADDLALHVLCALHRAADRHRVPVRAVGDWLVQADLGADLSPDVLVEQFGAVFDGHFPNEQAFLDHVLTARGWRDALAAAGISEEYLDLRRLRLDLLHTTYRLIRLHNDGVVAIRREPRSVDGTGDPS
jgi:hypothetical protein